MADQCMMNGPKSTNLLIHLSNYFQQIVLSSALTDPAYTYLHMQEAHDFNPLNGPDGELVWTSLTGQNFTAQHDSPHIDFCGAHYWPDVWVRACACMPHILTSRPMLTGQQT